MINLILLLYVVPMIIVFLIIYFDEKAETVGDLLKDIWYCLFPGLNLFLAICFPIFLITQTDCIQELRKKIINTKLKK